jgi:hypothetical protein
LLEAPGIGFAALPLQFSAQFRLVASVTSSGMASPRAAIDSPLARDSAASPNMASFGDMKVYVST